MHMDRWKKAATVSLALMAAAIATPAAAQTMDDEGGLNFVPRVGVTAGPEQFTVGVEFPMGNVADIENLVFAPAGDIGWGDNRTSIRASANLGYAIESGEDGDSRIFPLVGVSLYYQSLDLAVTDDTVFEDSMTGFGVNLGAGTQVGALVLEGLIGIGDIPDFAVWVGYAVGS